jgi:hypothetical protein
MSVGSAQLTKSASVDNKDVESKMSELTKEMEDALESSFSNVPEQWDDFEKTFQELSGSKRSEYVAENWLHALFPKKTVWYQHLRNQFEMPYFHKLSSNLFRDYFCDKLDIFPSACNIFRAYSATDFDEIYAILVGQNPYHNNKYEACGLAFALADPEMVSKISPSVKNLVKVLCDNYELDLKKVQHVDYTLKAWTKRVLLLNTHLTVIQGNSNSHMVSKVRCYSSEARITS